MDLEKWLEYGWLRREPSIANEIEALQGIVQRSLNDSKVDAISADLRFVASFTAALTAATIALRASGYRTVTQAGHHTKIIESLELTIGADSKLIQKLKVFSNKRNKSVYDVAGAFSDQDLKEIAKGLEAEGRPWLASQAEGCPRREIHALTANWRRSVKCRPVLRGRPSLTSKSLVGGSQSRP